MSRIVELSDAEPLLIEPSELDSAVWICRCGLAANWPYCDGSHSATRQEEPGEVYAYHRRKPGGRLHVSVVTGLPREADPRPSGD